MTTSELTNRVRLPLARRIIGLEKAEEKLRSHGFLWTAAIIKFFKGLMIKRWKKVSARCRHINVSSLEETGWSSFCFDCGRWSS